MVKATKFEDVIKAIKRFEPNEPQWEGRYQLFLVSGMVALTDGEYEELGSPEEGTVLQIRIKNMERTS